MKKNELLVFFRHQSNQSKRRVERAKVMEANPKVVEAAMNPKQERVTFMAMVRGKTVLPGGRKVELENVGSGFWLIVRAETDKGEMRSTEPMTLFLKESEFAPFPKVKTVIGASKTQK